MKSTGFTLIELMIVVAIIGILATIALPAFKLYTIKSRYTEIVLAAQPYKLGVETCLQNGKSLADCDAGRYGIPPAVNSSQGQIASITVTDGQITITPEDTHGLTSSDTYILTPSNNIPIRWAVSGGAVTAGYVMSNE